MSARPSRRLRNVFLSVLVIAILYTAYRYTLHRIVESKLNEIHKQGYPVTLDELDKWYPQVLPGENAAEIYGQAFSKFHETGWYRLRLLQPNYDDYNTEWPKHTERLSDKMRVTVQQCLDENKEALPFLHKASAFDKARYPIDLSRGPDAPLPHLQKLRFSAQLLALEATVSVESGDKVSALKSVADCLAAGRSLVNEPILISQSVRRNIAKTGVKALEHVTNIATLDDSELSSMALLLSDEEIPYGTPRAVIERRCMIIDIFDQLNTGRISKEDKEGLLSGDLCGQPPIPRVLFPCYKAAGFLDLDLLKSLTFLEAYVAVSEMPFAGRRSAGQAAEDPDEDCLQSWRYHFTSILVPGISSFIKREASYAAVLRSARTALAVERFRIANTRAPEKLDEIIPTFLRTLPEDPFSGQPLSYKKLANGYVVYSVGEDGKDDGGDEKKDITFTVER